MRFQFTAQEVTAPQGIEIGVLGFQSSPADHMDFPSQVYIEVHEGRLRICVWDGSSEDPIAVHVIEPVSR